MPLKASEYTALECSECMYEVWHIMQTSVFHAVDKDFFSHAGC